MSKRTIQVWGGAGLRVYLPTEEKIEPYDDVVVITKYANELKDAIEEIKTSNQSKIDYLNKYEFYPELGKYYIQLIETNGDVIENIQLILNKYHSK